jgi:hypothetical protein
MVYSLSSAVAFYAKMRSALIQDKIMHSFETRNVSHANLGGGGKFVLFPTLGMK